MNENEILNPSTNSKPLFSAVRLNLNSPDGNAFAIMGTVKKVLEVAKVSEGVIDSILKEMKSGDYDNLCEIAGRIITLYKTEHYENQDEYKRES